MNIQLDKVEKDITEFWTDFIRSTLFFLDSSTQALIISAFHYIIFIAGFYYFFFYSKPKDTFRLIFFIFVVIASISYYTFNKCFLTLIELNLSNEKNIIQNTIDKYFGKQTEGNITSKVVLTGGSIILGIILLRDYNFIK